MSTTRSVLLLSSKAGPCVCLFQGELRAVQPFLVKYHTDVWRDCVCPGWRLYGILQRIKKGKKRWMYPSLEGMLCSLWLFLFLFYTQCMYYLWPCFWGVHWFKRICYKMCYIRIYYPVYGSLSTINHGNILTGLTQFMSCLCYEAKKEMEDPVYLFAPLWTQFYV